MAVEERSYTAILTKMPAQQLTLQHAICNEKHTLVLTGELDTDSAPALNEALAHICRDGTTAVVLDLRKLTFMDSSGIRAVLLTQALCAEHGCELRLLPGQPQVQRAFAICDLLDRLPFRDDADDVASETSGPPRDLRAVPGPLAARDPSHGREHPSGDDS
jgi:anti-anti-sigma factor